MLSRCLTCSLPRTRLANADEATQEEVLAGRAQFLNSQQSTGLRSLFARAGRSRWALAPCTGRASLLPKRWRSARDYVGFCRRACRISAHCFERHCYGSCCPTTQVHQLCLSVDTSQLLTLSRLAGARQARPRMHGDLGRTSQRRLICALRPCFAATRTIGWRTQRLDSHSLAELFHRCWSPELARVQAPAR